MQSSFSDLEYAAKKKLTRRDRFLAGIHAATSWAALEAEIEPFYPKGEDRGRPPIANNKAKARDLDIHQTKKGNNWHVGVKAHIGVDAQSGLVHTLVTTAANTSDISLLHGQERRVFGDAGYQGVKKRPENQSKTVEWLVAMNRSVRKALPVDELGRPQDRFEKLKANIRAKVEHPFHVIKNLFRHRKTRYRELAKNEAQLFSLFGFANLVFANRQLPAIHGRGAF